MGQDQSNQKDLLNEAFNIVQTISPGQYLVRRKKKGDELQLRILTFYLQQQMQDYMRLLDRRKKIKNPHLLELIQHTQINQQNMCSASFKIKTLVEYPFKTIKDQIEERSSFHPKRYFSEDQMWSILYSCSLALHTLYLNKFNHQALNTTQIFIDTSGIIKIADNVLINCEKNHLSILNDNTNQSTVRYISPQLVNLVEDNHFYFYEKEKSDVFILGLIMLQITNLQVVKYYNKKTKKFSFQESCKALAKSQNSYSPQLTQLFQKMLLLDFKVRPRFQDIIRSIQQKTIYTGSSLNSSFQINVEKNFKTALNLKEDSKYLKTLDYQKHDRQWSLPPSNNIYVQQNGNLSHFVSKAQKQYPSITPTDSIFNFQPNYLTTITHPVKSDFQVKKQPNLEVGTKLSSYLPFIDPHINKYRFQPNSENSKIDTVLRNSNKNSDETYTPYMQLLNLTQKTNNANPTKIISNFNANKFQTVVCQPSEKPKISIRFNSSPLKEQKKTEVPTILPAYPATLEGRQSQQFSQVKFGKIQLSNILENVSNNYTVSIGQKVSQLQVRPFEVSSTTSHPGTFTIENYQQGKFQGFKINDKKNGVGRFIYVNGSYYQGEWKDDMMDGFGKLYYPNGQIAYEGHWYYSSFQGTGKLYNEDPKYSTKDPIDYTDLSTVQNRWVNYQGQFQNDEKKGKGTILLANGQTFTGIFVRDMAQGEGCYYKLNGETIKGRWSKNLYIGA